MNVALNTYSIDILWIKMKSLKLQYNIPWFCKSVWERKKTTTTALVRLPNRHNTRFILHNDDRFGISSMIRQRVNTNMHTDRETEISYCVCMSFFFLLIYICNGSSSGNSLGAWTSQDEIPRKRLRRRRRRKIGMARVICTNVIRLKKSNICE